MAKFINTRKAASELEDLIKNAGEKLILVSPYLKLSKDFKELLTYRSNKDKVTTIIFGKQELKPDEMTFLQSLRLLVLKYHEDLHAKCYVNDDRMIITSMNLYEFSMRNNKEMGVLVDRNDPSDTQLFEEAMKEIEYISANSPRFNLDSILPSTTTVSDATQKGRQESQRKPTSSAKAKVTGYCIRTGVEIPFNVEKPLSYEAFKSWSKYGDPDYAEKFCHFSGEPSHGDTSVAKPILKKNWKKAKEVFDL
jgi:phosphatidylserine/phosphatidylglycerophosphate/cardiolipin synthase-like enzyme